MTTKKLVKKVRCFLTAAVVFLLAAGSGLTAHAADNPSIQYTLWNKNGEKKTAKDWAAAGDESQSRTEANDYWNAISMKIVNNNTGYSGDVWYSIHVHDVGWSQESGKLYSNGQKCYYDTVNGFTTPYPWIEGVSAMLKGDLSNYYYIDYNVRVAPLSTAFRNSLGTTVDEDRYKAGLDFYKNKAVANGYWVGFEKNLSDVLGSGYSEEGLANDGGLNFAGTYGMAMPISAFKARILKLNTYATIDPNGGTWGGQTDTYTKWLQAGVDYTSSNPTRTGYTFAGWEVTSAQKSIKISALAKKGDDGELKNKNNKQDPETDKPWQNASGKELKKGSVLKPGQTTISGGNMKLSLKARWTANSYTIKYDGNGKTSGTMANTSATYDTAVTLRANTFKRTGYTFKGWAKTEARANAGTVDYTDKKSVENLTSTAGGTVTLYAVWEDNAGSWYYNANGGAITDSPHLGGSYYYQLNSNGTVQRSDSGTSGFANYKPTIKYSRTTELNLVNASTFGFSRTGYHLKSGAEWNTAKDGAGVSFPQTGDVLAAMKAALSLSTTDGTSLHLYANWEPNTYTIQYNGNNATSGSMANTPATYDKNATLRANAFTRTGYTFTGWNTEADGSGTAYSPGQGVKNLTSQNNGLITLYAQWKANPISSHTLTVKPNGGTWEGKTEDQKLTLTAGATKAIADPTRDGFAFDGWSLSGAGSSLTGTTFTMGNADAVLTAQWTANQYTIRFDGNGATEGSMEDLTAAVGTSFTLPENGYRRTTDQGESLFKGWTRQPESHEAEFADQETVSQALASDNGAVVILYAVWDDCPLIDAKDRYFTLEQAQNGEITQEELLRKVVATDPEDNRLENGTSVIVAAYQPEDFTSFTADGSVSVTYQATDSAGNQVYETVTAFIVDTALKTDPEVSYVRKISPQFYKEGDAYVPTEQGGLETESIWKTDDSYRTALDYAMGNQKTNETKVTLNYLGKEYTVVKPGTGNWDHKVSTWVFTKKQLQEVDQFITDYGFANYRTNGIEKFYELFGDCRQVE